MNEFIEELKNVSKRIYAAIEASRTTKAKYFLLRQKIYESTKFLPEEFKVSDRIYCLINNITTWPKLCGCGCGGQVSAPHRNYLSAHGNKSEKVKNKKKNTFQEKYGVDNCSQLDEVKKKKEQTSLQKYGVPYYLQNEQEKEKHKQNNIQKLGVENPFQLKSVIENNKKIWSEKKEEILEKRVISQRINYFNDINKKLSDNIITVFNKEEYQGVFNKYPFYCKKCDKQFLSTLLTPKIKCPFCAPKFESQPEFEILDFISSLNLPCYHNERQAIAPMEIDIFIPSKNIGIEYDGLYWHTENKLIERMPENKSFSKVYHLYKTKKCQEKNIKLIHIFEDEWSLKKQIVKSRIKTILNCQPYKLNARECIIKEIDSRLCNKFLEKYHLQGKDNAPIRLGLFYKNRLIAVMTFSKTRIALGHATDKGYELGRFATIFNFSIRGGASKLLSYFEKTYKPKKLITYADRRWSEGNLYYKLGFTLDHVSPPNYWYLNLKNSIERIHRFNFRKSELPKKLGENIDMTKTESQLMFEAGYDKIWDCGNLVFEKNY